MASEMTFEARLSSVMQLVLCASPKATDATLAIQEVTAARTSTVRPC